MLIPIGFSTDGCPEWAIIEWQGDVEHRPEHMPDDLGNMDIGTLSITVRHPPPSISIDIQSLQMELNAGHDGHMEWHRCMEAAVC